MVTPPLLLVSAAGQLKVGLSRLQSGRPRNTFTHLMISPMVTVPLPSQSPPQDVTVMVAGEHPRRTDRRAGPPQKADWIVESFARESQPEFALGKCITIRRESD